MKETLEGVARAIFKSWFVDFDPVRSKTEGRDTGLPKHIADLFPDSFVDSELGEIPRGWEIRGLDKIAVFLNGLALQKYPPKDGGSLPVIKIAQLRTGNTDRADKASIDLDPNYIVADGDVLFSWSGSLECVFWAGGPGALNQHLFKVSSTYYPKWFYYLWIHEHLKNFRHIAAGKATTMGHIQRHHLSDAKAIIPNPGVFNAANNLIAPIIDRIIHLRIESRTLAALRDTLLPKLINGELRVKECREIYREDPVMPDSPTQFTFVMRGARAAISGGMSHFEEQVKGIEYAVANNPSLAFDLAKTIIESTCKTILKERGIAYDPADDLPKLFKAATINLPFLPALASNESEIRKKLTKTLNGLHTAVQGICELRNACGFASHGTESEKPEMEATQALLAAETSDAIVGFLYRVHRQDRQQSDNSKLEYDDNSEFNEHIDEIHELVRVFEVEFKPSEVLYRMDSEAYRVYLTEYNLTPVVEESIPTGNDE